MSYPCTDCPACRDGDCDKRDLYPCYSLRRYLIELLDRVIAAVPPPAVHGDLEAVRAELDRIFKRMH